ncbi:hypothetical protein V2J94_19730 [Streptomyces sp. DSM 41524]|uniref:Uncharacterized protein n=1 Tax=Streptomyces asiaticus subsp. ignotus TaxID=3098222 RepID=A0ABU7PYA7_9ACTN|nr:hypothetical protein [Streptomyces sp. DSM 41524]
MAANKGRDAKPERLPRSALHRKGLRYRVSARPIADLRRTTDVVFTKVRAAVFLYGYFVHICPRHHRATASPARSAPGSCRRHGPGFRRIFCCQNSARLVAGRGLGTRRPGGSGRVDQPSCERGRAGLAALPLGHPRRAVGELV